MLVEAICSNLSLFPAPNRHAMKAARAYYITYLSIWEGYSCLGIILAARRAQYWRSRILFQSASITTGLTKEIAERRCPKKKRIRVFSERLICIYIGVISKESGSYLYWNLDRANQYTCQKIDIIWGLTCVKGMMCFILREQRTDL